MLCKAQRLKRRIRLLDVVVDFFGFFDIFECDWHGDFFAKVTLECKDTKKFLYGKRKFTGQVVNPNNNETYTVEELDVKMTQSAENPKKLELRLDNIEHTHWLNQKEEQRKQRIALRPPQQTKRSGMKI